MAVGYVMGFNKHPTLSCVCYFKFLVNRETISAPVRLPFATIPFGTTVLCREQTT